MIVGDVLFDAPSQALQQSVNAVDLGLELQAEADAAARFLPLEIDAGPVMPRAPRAGGLGAVTLDFARLAELTSDDSRVRLVRLRCEGDGILIHPLHIPP